MATMTVLKFSTADGARQALDTVESLSKQHLINLHDAAIVTWPGGKKKPKTKQMANLAGIGALDGAFWGMLFGLIFFVPFFGMAVGAAMGALSGKFADYGIDDDFINSVRDQVTEGTSALFLMTSDAFNGVEFELIASNLSKEQEDELRAAFA
jgi:uncharacterized membrane protein